MNLRLIGNLFLILSVLGFLILAIFGTSYEHNITNVDCYDEFNNKINELTCEKDSYGGFKGDAGLFLIPIFLLSLVGFAMRLWDLE